jgi:hypothetical protein
VDVDGGHGCHEAVALDGRANLADAGKKRLAELAGRGLPNILLDVVEVFERRRKTACYELTLDA